MDDVFKIVDELKYNISKANDLYRVGEDSYMSDQHWDDMLDELSSMIPREEFDEFRETLFAKAGKVKHTTVIGSLRKSKAEDDSLPKWMSGRVGRYHVSSKVDGLSMVLKYRGGILVDAMTRGDGEYGESQLDKVKHIVPTRIEGFDGELRGEVTLTFDSFETLCQLENKEYKNLRNASVGVVNRKDINIDSVKCLEFIAYQVIGSTMNKTEQYAYLEDLGFNPPHRMVIDTGYTGCGDSIIESMKLLYSEFKEIENFEIDGLVIHDEDFKCENVKLPENTIAFKVNTAYTSKAIGIEANLSMNGLMKPVLLIEPTEIAGTIVSRATLHNYKNVIESKIHYGDEIELQKSGEIIPYILNVNECDTTSELIEIPTVCPHCNSGLIFDDDDSVDLRCPNKYCEKQIQLKLTEFIKRIGVNNVSEKSLIKFGIGNFVDLMKWEPNPKYKSEMKFYDELMTKVFTSTPEEIFSCMVFDGLGKSTVEKLLDVYNLTDLVDGYNVTTLPEGVGDLTMDSFYKVAQDNYLYTTDITCDERFTLKEEAPKVVGGILDGLTFCITGNLESMSRDEAFKMVVSHGADTRTSVSSKLSYLVNNDLDSPSGKNKKAKSLGIPIINEVQLLAMVSEKDNTCGDLFDM